MQVQPINPIYYNYSYQVQKVHKTEGNPTSCQPLKPLDYSVYHSEIKRVSIYEPLSPKITDKNVRKEIEPLEVRPEVLSSEQISFGYSNKLKTLYKQGLLPTVKKGFYGGILSNDVVTLEHLLPHSKGGPTCLSNLVLSTAENNFKRGNKDLALYFKPEAAREYLKQFEGIKLKKFKGDKYIKIIKKTLEGMGLFV